MNEWISVNDRFPEQCQNVITYREEFGSVFSAVFLNGKFQAVNIVRGGFEDLVGDVTHWMPLPEPPKGERDEEL